MCIYTYTHATVDHEHVGLVLQVAETIYWLGRVVEDLPGYCGPQLDLDLSYSGEFETPVQVRERHAGKVEGRLARFTD